GPPRGRLFRSPGVGGRSASVEASTPWRRKYSSMLYNILHYESVVPWTCPQASPIINRSGLSRIRAHRPSCALGIDRDHGPEDAILLVLVSPPSDRHDGAGDCAGFSQSCLAEGPAPAGFHLGPCQRSGG